MVYKINVNHIEKLAQDWTFNAYPQDSIQLSGINVVFLPLYG